ncbi:MAG: SpoIIE family protein phosphatase [Candidatus Eremiobacteraeota bacterium]|nr:SpoIIE family protein phosphatase [Candidatus Eremiobacteraeota bacterium]
MHPDLQVPTNETDRLRAVRRFDVLDTPADGSFDRITRIAAKRFNVPIALVTIVDEDRIWFKSRFGLDAVKEIPRDPGLCASAICADSPYIIEDAKRDPRALANSLVAGEFGLRFYAAAPLKTHEGYSLGTLCIIDREARQFTAGEYADLQELAGVVVDELELRLAAIRTVTSERWMREQSAALAAENQRLYENEHRVAEALQRALLPQSFPTIENMRFDVAYAPAATGATIGGDWFDAFLIAPDRLILSIGDVAGHGLHVAALMGKLRQSLRALAVERLTPVELLRSLDAMLRRENPDAIATAFVGVLQVSDGQLFYANAGHPPALLRTADGTVVELQEGQGLPLGLRGNDEKHGVSKLLPDCLLVLYTDGLTEATRNLFEGERLLRTALAGAEIVTVPKPAEFLRSTVLTEGSTDDVAILTLQFHPAGPPAHGR